MNRYECFFFLDNKLFASNLPQLPNIGDEVRFNLTTYRINNKVWCFDEVGDRVNFNIEKTS